MRRDQPNALPDDPDWCGHAFVSLRSWTCANCEQPATTATRLRLEQASTVAPSGSLWVLLSGDQDVSEDGMIQGTVDGLFTDRSKIAHRLIRGWIMGKEHIRDIMRRTHWYQGAFNDMLFEGWEEEPDERGECRAYSLSIEQIDAP